MLLSRSGFRSVSLDEVEAVPGYLARSGVDTEAANRVTPDDPFLDNETRCGPVLEPNPIGDDGVSESKSGVETRSPDCIRPTSAAEPLREPRVGLLGVLDPDSTACFFRGGNPSPSFVDARESGRPPVILINPCIMLALRRISSFSASVIWGSFFRGLFRL